MTLKTKATKAIALVLATSFAATAALPVTAAEAGSRDYPRDYRDGRHIVKKHSPAPRKYHRKHRGNDGDALAAGIIGFAIGAIIADQATRYRQPEVIYVEPQPRYITPLPRYVEPKPVYREPYVERRPLQDNYDRGPKVIRYEDEFTASYEPWTPEWARWCDDNYRSFNINTGTYRGYDGKDHFCVVK